METSNAISALTALGHAPRLAAFRLLVEAGPAGRMAGDIATALQVPPATLSFHLKELVQAGLVDPAVHRPLLGHGVRCERGMPVQVE
ncbi:helix-turn-helix transcriptional regulator, partial [Mycobacterium tuberculosis]|nr:helix-turn-helix transcriptional regulator [Mycobacterium tuberculosis]